MRTLLGLLALCCGGLSQADPLPKDWSPEVETARELLTAQLEEGPPQQMMNRITSALAELADAELAVVYLRLHDALPAQQQIELRQKQEQWLKKREKHAADAVESEGGSLAPTEANLAFEDFTRKRTAELRQHLEKLLEKESAR